MLIIRNHFQNIFFIDFKKCFKYIINIDGTFTIIKNSTPICNNAKNLYKSFFSKYYIIDCNDFILVINKYNSDEKIYSNSREMDSKLLEIYMRYKEKEQLWQ